MNKILDLKSLNLIKEENIKSINDSKCRILICAGTGCLASGSDKIYEKMVSLCSGNSNVEVSLESHVDHGDIQVKKSGCHGFCEMGPLMKIEPLGILYTKVKLEDCEEIVEKSIKDCEKEKRIKNAFRTFINNNF